VNATALPSGLDAIVTPFHARSTRPLATAGIETSSVASSFGAHVKESPMDP